MQARQSRTPSTTSSACKPVRAQVVFYTCRDHEDNGVQQNSAPHSEACFLRPVAA